MKTTCVRKALQATEDFKNGKISVEELKQYAYAAADAAYAASAYAKDYTYSVILQQILIDFVK